MYQDKMAPKLFLNSLILIFLVAVSQAKRPHIEFFKLLNQASEDQKIQFLKTSFEFYDANDDGFLTSDESDDYDYMDCGNLYYNSKVFCLSYIREAVTEALIQFEQENENGFATCGIEPKKIGITFEDCKHALKRQLEQIYAKKRRNLELAELNQASGDQKTRFFKASFELYDSNKDGFVTSDEFDNVDLGALPLNSFIMETMTEASIQFEQEHESCTFLSLSTELLLDQCYVIPCNEIGITFEDYKDVLKMKLEQIFRKKN